MTAIWGWLAGRKTYILAGLVVLTILVLVFLGRLTPEAAYTIALTALAGFAVTFRSALADHQAQVISVLMDVGQLGVAVRTGNRAGELAVAQDLAKQGIALVEQPPEPAPSKNFGETS
jgi:hypothetical protein